MYPGVRSPSGRCAFEVDRAAKPAAADNATAHEAPRMLEQLRRQLEIPTGDVVGPLDGPLPAHPHPGPSGRGVGQDLPAQVQGLVADPSALAKHGVQ